MVFFNYALRKLNAKIVYYGPGLCGKTTNLQWIHDHFEGGQRGKMISLATEGDRTIFFDLLPIEIGTIRGMQVTLQLYTVPGQVHYNSTRQLVLRGADGVVFVADSQRTMQTSNLDSFKNLQENMLLQGINLETSPLALQFNKRDLRDLISTEELNEQLNVYSVPIFEAIATEGVGVQETLEGIVKLVMRSLRERYEPVAGVGAKVQPAPARPPTVPAAPPEPMAPSISPQPAGGMEPPSPATTFPAGETPFAGQSAGAAGFASTLEPPPVGEVPADGTFEDEVNTAVYDLGKETAGDELDNLGGITDAAMETLLEPEIAEADAPDDFDFGGSVDEFPEPAPVIDSIDEPFAEAETASGIEIVGMDAIAIGEESGQEPQLDIAPPPPEVERYEDRIEAPSPFAPRQEATAEAVPGDDLGPFGPPSEPGEEPAGESDLGPFAGEPDAPPEEALPEEPPGTYVMGSEPIEEVPAETAPPVTGESWESAEVADDVRQAFGSGENLEALASLVADEVKAEEAVGVAEVAETVEVEEVAEVSEAVEAEEAAVSEPAEIPASEPAAEPEPEVDHVAFHRPPTEAIMVGEGDPFTDLRDRVESEVMASIEPARRREVDIRAEDNQLHLRLQGTGAIVESGQVRALDIEVPVPGSWVGNRRVTLQLRLTLSPVAEDEDGGSGDPS